MKQILSIQSHVAFGHVGNAAAVFPLQRLGHEVIAINTVQFSNHTGYGDWTGEVFPADHIKDILTGLKTRGALDKIDALLTGYLGDPAVGEIILDALPGMPWLCDPVMGDVGRGFFVREGIPDFFKNRALPRATIVTPNQFELEYLSGIAIRSIVDARRAIAAIHDAGPEIVLVTSLIHEQTRPDEISMLVSSKHGGQFVATTPRLPLDPAPNGAGDVTAALFLGHYINGNAIETVLAKTAASIFALFEETMKAGTRELALIAAQERFAAPPSMSVETL